MIIFAVEEPAGLTLEELEAGLFGVGMDRLKLGLLIIVVLKLSVQWK